MANFLKDLANVIKNMPKEAKKPLDRSIVVIIALLTCFGLIMIWSASMYNASIDFGDELYYVKRQAIIAVFGFVLMYLISLIDYHFIKKYANLIMAISLLLLLFVAFLPDTEGVNGAVRWISIGGYGLQPSELAKICVLIFLAKEFDRRQNEINQFKTFLLMMAFCAVICGMIYLQPALSTSVVVAALIIGMYFMAGGNFFYILGFLAIGGFGVYRFIVGTEWRMQRIFAYLDPWSDITGSGWQPAQSLMALGSGGLFGVGIGNGRAKLIFLPEPQNDYIFAVIGEELGLIGCVLLLSVYFVLITKIMKLSFRIKDRFAQLLAAGVSVLLAIQVFINVAVVTNLIPSTGITLPFISYGGSSLVSILISMGIVLNISRNQQKAKRRET
jgi:cell division protein FtsW